MDTHPMSGLSSPGNTNSPGEQASSCLDAAHSRRGFVTNLGKVSLGATAFVGGLLGLVPSASAQGDNTGNASGYHAGPDTSGRMEALMEQETIAWVKVRLLGLNPGESEIEYQISPTGPLAAAGNYSGSSGRKETIQKFIHSVKRELDHDFAWDEQNGT
ncbi:MAG: hypothetical protein ACR2GA_06575 [Chloroflexota bacterium]